MIHKKESERSIISRAALPGPRRRQLNHSTWSLLSHKDNYKDNHKDNPIFPVLSNSQYSGKKNLAYPLRLARHKFNEKTLIVNYSLLML